MGMCYACGDVFSANEMNEGFCKNCDNEEGRKTADIHGRYGQERITLVLDKKEKYVSVGFSFWALLFGNFTPLFKKDYYNFFKYSIFIFTGPLIWIYLGFFYNKIYIKRLLKKGYTPLDTYSRIKLERHGILKTNKGIV